MSSQNDNNNEYDFLNAKEDFLSQLNPYARERSDLGEEAKSTSSHKDSNPPLESLTNFFRREGQQQQQPSTSKSILQSQEFTDFKAQKFRESQQDLQQMRIQQLESENEQLKKIVQEMRKEIEVIRDRTVNSNAHAQTIYELRREVYKLQADKKSLELEREFLLNSQQQQQDSTLLLQQLNDKESELYELKIKLIQKENECLSLNQRSQTQERQVFQFRQERDKLLEISGELRQEIAGLERERDTLKQRTNQREQSPFINRDKHQVSTYQESNQLESDQVRGGISTTTLARDKPSLQSERHDELKESRLEQLRLEVEYMRGVFNQFKFSSSEQNKSKEDQQQNINAQSNQSQINRQEEELFQKFKQRLNSELEQQQLYQFRQINNYNSSQQVQKYYTREGQEDPVKGPSEAPSNKQVWQNDIQSNMEYQPSQYQSESPSKAKRVPDYSQAEYVQAKENERINHSNSLVVPDRVNHQVHQPTKREKSKKRLQELKQNYNSQALEDMFPLRDSIEF